MRINKTIWAIGFSLISCIVFAQTNLITGKIVIDDAIDGQDVVENITVMNQTTNAKAVTNNNGMFSIKASVGDELLFQHDFYKERILKISQDMLKKGFITIHLNVEVIELAEARINDLKKDWKQNIKNEKTADTKMYEGLGLDTNMQYVKVNPNMTSSINHGGALDPALWISMISGQRKKEMRRNEYFKKVDKIKDLEDYFTTNYFIEVLNIPANKVNDYVTYCYANFNLEKLIKQNDYDKILTILEEQAPIYLEMIKR